MVKRAVITKFIPVEQPIEHPITKFGGQPNWIESPEWPISKECNYPMQFIGQIRIPEELFPGCGEKMAYIFITSDDVAGAGMVETWDPWGGENAVIIQPGGDNTSNVQPLVTGPTVQSYAGSLEKYVAVEYAVELVISEEPAQEMENDFDMMEDEEINEIEGLWGNHKIGGVPSFIQPHGSIAEALESYFPSKSDRIRYFSRADDSITEEDTGTLLLQISDGVPFYINFATGVGHVFINRSGKAGIFFWETD